ncbi:hypothetical protein DYB32_002800 [Aphanomyces invadans]|uniref:DDE-1 domain-containing protein n=1 Tax=Aphanomyces invadans TaxID=157072 RepID=A0A3R6ZTE2_9STRA|nr:hypothetical protein DYB32_002800 [Aphanomyces invadans]
MDQVEPERLAPGLPCNNNKNTAAYNSLLRLLQRFFQCHGFSRQRQTENKLKQSVLNEAHQQFAADFHREYASYDKNCVYNVDETGMYYDIPPTYIWAVKGGCSKISCGEKHSMRMTGVLTVTADGGKLPLMIIMKGKPGDWTLYLRDVLGERIGGLSVVLVENFDAHVSDEEYKIMYDELGAHLCPVPPNSTSVCQPLDVGVMAPFKRNLRNLWLYEEQVVGDDEDPYSLSAKQKRMTMVKRAISAWDLVTEDIIRQCFAKAIPQ